ncbi:MAG: hypothetical protein WCA39_17225 [Nitrososphaeraceae archaeon]
MPAATATNSATLAYEVPLLVQLGCDYNRLRVIPDQKISFSGMGST